MAIWDKLTGELVDIIEWLDDTRDTMVWRFPRYQNEIKNGAKLIVRESQVAAFVNEGQIADMFLFPGTFTLTTQNLPILSTLRGWKHGFNSPFKAEVYFISQRIFTDRKWGTKNPIMMRDPEFGPIRLRAFGTFAMRISRPGEFLKQVVGTNSRFTVDQIGEQLRDLLVSRFADALAEGNIPALDLASQQDEIGEKLRGRINSDFDQYGLEVTQLFVENISLPPEVEAALDKRTSIGVLGNLDQYQKYQTGVAMEEAAKNPSGMAGMGAGLGAGMVIGQQMGGAMRGDSQSGSQPPAQAGGSATPPPLPESVQFYVALDGQQTGPFNMQQLESQATGGRLKAETLVWRKGMAEWAAAGSMPELTILFGAMRPPLRK